MPEWTTQQRAAIETRGRSIIVSAAAGSGKTAVLVERLLRILSDHLHPVYADRIIVVTFTNDAAAQMKQRLTKALTERLSVLEEGAEYDWLAEQRVRLSGARIATINSFCFEMVRENADLLDVLPNFSIAEEGQNSICQRQALNTVMERWTAEKPEMQVLYDHFCVKSDSDLEERILSVGQFLESVAFPDIWIREARRLAENSDILFEQLRRSYCDTLSELIGFYEKGRPIAEQCLTRTDPKKGNKFVTFLNTELIAMREQLAYLKESTRETICADPLAKQVTFPTLSPPRNDVDPAFKEAFTQLRTLVKKRYAEQILGISQKPAKKGILKHLPALRYFAEDAEISAKLIPLLMDLTEDYLEALRLEKQERNLLAFADAEDLTLRLLAAADADGTLSKSALASQLSDQYDLIMVDEYQDTNNKQDSIFKLLSHGTRIDADGLHYGDNAFVVGDVKQSIYSFRQANPENFRAAIDESRPLAAGEEGMALIHLNQNFRSATGVLDFVNMLFAAVMRADCGDVDYTEDEQLNPGSPLYRNFPDKTQILLACEDADTPREVHVQAECIADTIAGMIGRADVRIPGADGTVTTRPAQAGDFCILMRAVKGHAEPYLEALHRRGIAAAMDSGSGLLEYPEIHLIRALLCIADNPMTDVAMASVMLSAVGGFTTEELAQLRLETQALFLKRRQRGRLYQRMRVFSRRQAPEALQALHSKVKSFLKLIDSLKEAADRLPLEDAVWECYHLTDLLALQSVYDDAAERRSHLDAFARMAGSYSNYADLTAQSCLSGWLRYLERVEGENGKHEVKGSAEVRGCVRIKTIHRSKGLEFPFVFVTNLEKKFNRDGGKAIQQAASDGMLGLKIYDRSNLRLYKTAAFTHILSAAEKRQTSEEMRLLYVALTRAEQQLFLVMDQDICRSLTEKAGALLDLDPGMVPYFSRYAIRMQDWVMYALLSGRDREHIRRLIGGEESRGEYADYRIWRYQPVVQAQIPASQTKPDPDAAADMRRHLGCTYRTEQSDLIAKITVTQLAHPEKGILEQRRKPKFTSASTKNGIPVLRANEHGTAVHKIMQLLDFPSAAQDPEAALNALLEENAITPSEHACLTPAHLAKFFASPLYQRIAAAETVERERKIFVELGTLELPAVAAPYQGTDGTMIGTMDLVFREPDGWVIVDYKTDQDMSEAELTGEYAMQLLLYRAALEQITGEPVKELYLYSFALDKALEIP